MIMDDIYHRLLFDGQEPISAYTFTDRDTENTRVLVVNGVSKLYGLTGVRIGWAIANRRLVEVMANVQSQITSCPSVVSRPQPREH
jgi:aspartate aminotransferase